VSEAISIEFPEADRQAMFRQMDRAQQEFGKSAKDAIKWGGVYVARSLGASTIQAPKLRKIVKNPHPDAGRDKRRALVGVMKFNRTGAQYFQPIYRTGEFGNTRFEKNGDVTVFSPGQRQTFTREQYASLSLEAPSVKTSKRRIIGRRGLAKKAWKWIERNMDGGSGSVGDARDIASVRWGAIVGAEVRITNKLRYISKAIKGGYMGVSSAMARAARGMEVAMNLKLEAMKKKLEAA
jgi:hypothetical protein